MNYHTPITQNVSSVIPVFAQVGKELISPQKIYRKEQYPTLPYDMVKITSIDGRNIFIPLSKMSSMDL